MDAHYNRQGVQGPEEAYVPIWSIVSLLVIDTVVVVTSAEDSTAVTEPSVPAAENTIEDTAVLEALEVGAVERVEVECMVEEAVMPARAAVDGCTAGHCRMVYTKAVQKAIDTVEFRPEQLVACTA